MANSMKFNNSFVVDITNKNNDFIIEILGGRGPKGLKGDKGDTGEQGPKGDTGETGATGPKGDKGDTGETGAQGPKGDTGVQGPKGDKGDTGETGPKGDKGDDGYSPVKGTDYWTASDKSEIVSDVIEEALDYGTAPSAAVGMALVAKTISDGKVTEWEFGDAGGLKFHICTSSEYGLASRVPVIESPDEKTLYLVPAEEGVSPDLFVEWAYVNGTWEMFGSASIDLSDYITDVQVNGTSVVSGGVANVPVASANDLGVVKVDSGYGVSVNSSNNKLTTSPANAGQVKSGSDMWKPIVPYYQYASTFYGLAKAAGDTTQSQSSNTVGTYTDNAKAAIKIMLGVPDYSGLFAEAYDDTETYSVGDYVLYQNVLYKCNTDIDTAESFDSTHWDAVSVSDELIGKVQDVQVNGTSVVGQGGVAEIPIAGSAFGVVKTSSGYGITTLNGILITSKPSDNEIKGGTEGNKVITPYLQHKSAFYALAKAAGDTTQSASSNTVGNYTDNAKAAIKAMIGVTDSAQTVQVSGTAPTITAVANTRYICGEVTSLDFTPSATGICDVIFTSGSTVTVLTLPNTVRLPEWFDATSLDTNTTYEISITDGVYGAVMVWA